MSTGSAGDFTGVHSRILKTGQYKVEGNRYVVKAPTGFKRTKQQEIDESEKRIDDLRDEIKKMEDAIVERSEKSVKEAEEIVNKAEQEAERIVGESEKSAFERVKKSLDEREQHNEQKRFEGENIITEAKRTAAEIVRQAEEDAKAIKEQAHKEGQEAGREKGFDEGRLEIHSMVERLKSIIYATIQEREKILLHSEKQIMNLILTMVRKIVKKLTDEEHDVVINNIKEALTIIRGAMKVFIHVSPADYEYSTAHKDELIKLIEGMPEVKFFENPTIDRGGVIIETDIGDIDATIANQLEEIESKIKFYIPVQVKSKGLEQPSENAPDNKPPG